MECPHCAPADWGRGDPFTTEYGEAMLDHIEHSHRAIIQDLNAHADLLCGTCWEPTKSYAHRKACKRLGEDEDG